MYSQQVLDCFFPLLQLSAHHSFAAEYDRSKPVTLTGTVTKVEWMNPHVYFYMDVKDDKDGKVTNWAFEMGNPAGLYRNGWKKEALMIGGTATVARLAGKGWQAACECQHRHDGWEEAVCRIVGGQ